MTTIHFATAYHGNVGKSTFASVLEYCLSQSKRKTYLFDCDDEKQTLTKLYGEDNISQSLFTSDPELTEAADLILNAAIEHRDESPEIVVDLAADSDRHLNEWLSSRGMLTAAKKKHFQLIKWWVSSNQNDSLDALLASQSAYPEVQHILVKSHYATRAKFWKTVDSLPKIEAACKEGLMTIEFARGFGSLVRQVQEKGVSWQRLKADTAHEICSEIDKWGIDDWLDKNQSAINAVYPAKKKAAAKAKA